MTGALGGPNSIPIHSLLRSPALHWSVAAAFAALAPVAAVPTSAAPLLAMPAVLLAAKSFGLAGGLAGGAVAAALVRLGSPGPATPEVWLVCLLSLAAGAVAGVLFGTLLASRTRLRQSQMSTLRAFALAVESDESTSGEHCERVAHNSRELGRALGLNRRQLDELYWAGLLHDIGKLSIPREIFQKPGGLTLEEYLVMRRHARLGANLLQSIEGFERVAEGIGAHHERWDGSGYPKGLAGKEIPLHGRILAIVDVFEALSSDRPYRRALPPQLALEELRRNAGSHFDPALVALYEELYLEGRMLVSGENGDEEARQPPLGLRTLQSHLGEVG